MATAHDPEWATHPSAPHNFDDSPDHVAPLDDALPPPNPPFVFPAGSTAPLAPPPSNGRKARRRPMSAIEGTKPSFDHTAENADRPPGLVALPAFSFNPGAALPADPSAPPLLSPPVSPNSARAIPSPARPAGHGHRRGGSEFVGGRLREGNSIAVMSTSPTKSESGFASPTLMPPRRGHRRGVSSAISTNDLPILHPSPNIPLQKGSSAPNSPTNFDRMEHPSLPPIDALPNLPGLMQPTERRRDDGYPVTNTASPQVSPKQTKSGTRARVGFSDTLEFIPRPLSLVSSDTSSIATARRGHSVSGSISSILSAASPSGRESPAPLPRSPTRDSKDPRPSTAGAILERTPAINVPNASPRRRNSIPALMDLADASSVPAATPSPTKSSKRWSFFGLESLANSGSPSKTRPASSSSTESTPKAVPTGSYSDNGSDSSTETADAGASNSKKTKKSKKKKRVKGWAGSILPLKPKNQKKNAKSSVVRPPTPPASITAGPEEDDDDAEHTTRQPEASTPTLTITESASLPQDPKPPRRSAEDVSYQMIDLDAALGPFNTPVPHNPEWEAAQRAAGNAGKRRLHSAQGMKGFSGPGMHYHRRAESAPDLPPFDPGRSAIHRFGSTSTMADVFEEEEEEDDDDDEESKSTESDDSDGDTTPSAVTAKDSSSMMGIQDASNHTVRRTSSGLSDKDQTSAKAVRAECSKTSLQESVIVEEPTGAVFRNAPAFQCQRDSCDSAMAMGSPKKLSSTKELSPVEVGSPGLPAAGFLPTSPHSTSLGSSSHPSPRSPMSIDAQRISTAPSSVAEENSFQSLLMGEPGPEVRLSVDYDVPSLTSSRSTMTRESCFVPTQRQPLPTLRDQARPVSVSSAAFGRRRSSLISLSRLISSSHGERSKLSMEVTLDNENELRRSRDSRTKRLGRMMQFWKPNKDDATT